MKKFETWRALTFVGVLFLTTWNLTAWPATWFDEGSHLMVPKTLVQYGVYADRDDAGFRHFGPTLGVGPTVLLPIAGVFKLFGIGLLQARVVMAIYVLLAVLAFYGLARRLTGEYGALFAATLLVVSSGVGTLEFGRQVLGEVPGLFFLCLGSIVLVARDGSAVNRPGSLVLGGLLLGLAAVTKYQLLGVVGLGLGLAWLPGWRKGLGHLAVFVIPGAVAGAVFVAWQVFLMGYLGPSSFGENFRLFRQATAGAALVFSYDRMTETVRVLLAPGMLFGALIPAVAYGGVRAAREEPGVHGWRLVMGFVLVALGWFVVASIGWRRYAYPGVALACIPAAALLVDGFQLSSRHDARSVPALLRATALVWMLAILSLSLLNLVPGIASPRPRDAELMSAALNREVPPTALVVTWEHEVAFLTDHRYRVPPQGTLAAAVAHVWEGGPSPASLFDFMSVDPDYVLDGPFGRGVGLFPSDRLAAEFELVEEHGPYSLYRRKARTSDSALLRPTPQE